MSAPIAQSIWSLSTLSGSSVGSVFRQNDDLLYLRPGSKFSTLVLPTYFQDLFVPTGSIRQPVVTSSHYNIGHSVSSSNRSTSTPSSLSIHRVSKKTSSSIPFCPYLNPLPTSPVSNLFPIEDMVPTGNPPLPFVFKMVLLKSLNDLDV